MVKIIVNRDARILDAALTLAERDGYQRITRDAIAALAGVSSGTVTNILGTMPELKRAVLRAALERRNLTIVAQGLGARDPIVLGAPEEIRQAAIESLRQL